MSKDIPASPRFSFLRRFFHKEETGALFLLFSMAMALVWANSPWAGTYTSFWDMSASIGFAGYVWDLPLKHVIDEILMTLFFLLIGCELKRACLEGELSNRQTLMLPMVAAIGGMVFPALVYVAAIPSEGMTQGVTALRGWAIPTATDIAFALGVLGMLGSRVPSGLKVFLMALAVIDDIGAILLIGLFYTASLQVLPLLFAAVVLGLLFTLNRCHVRWVTPYLMLGAVLWFCFHKTGIHSTLSGVLLALFVPLSLPLPQKQEGDRRSPLKKLEQSIHPLVVYLVMPLFAFANAGVSFSGITAQTWVHPVTIGIIGGLFIGKPLGVLGASWVFIKIGLARLPPLVSWRHLFGAAALCGIGFTMSLFIGVLAFEDEASLFAVRLGVLSGSALSAVAGCALLMKRMGKQG
ncbi:MAG: Na+/H+ antiporter NhaA [Bdellovibrionales bacterium]